MNYSDAQLLDKFRQALLARGDRGIAGIGRAFNIEDRDKSGYLDKDEFQRSVHDFRVGISPPESDRLFKVFDVDRSGKLSYNEFLNAIQGEMNDFRKGLCMKAFAILDYDHTNIIDLSDIKHFYNAKQDPKVISGEKTEDQVLFEFLDSFDRHHHDVT